MTQRTYDPSTQFTNANGSTIWEAFGRVSTADSAVSVARVFMPPGITQALRRNQFDEMLIVIDGSCAVEMAGVTYTLNSNDVLHIPPNTPYRERVAGEQPCTAWAVCTPAYSFDLVVYDE